MVALVGHLHGASKRTPLGTSLYDLLCGLAVFIEYDGVLCVSLDAV